MTRTFPEILPRAGSRRRAGFRPGVESPEMSSSLAPVEQLYAFNTRLYEKALEGLDRDQSLRQPTPNGNPILWIAGHLASSRFGIAAMLGHERPIPWSKVF